MYAAWQTTPYIPDKNIKLYLDSEAEWYTLAIYMLSQPFSNGKVNKLVDQTGSYTAVYETPGQVQICV